MKIKECSIDHLTDIDSRLKKGNKFKIGDVVYVNDGSTNFEANGANRNGTDVLFQSPAKVLKVGLFIIKPFRLNIDSLIDLYEVADMLIKFETGEEIYVNSTLVKSTKFDLEKHKGLFFFIYDSVII